MKAFKCDRCGQFETEPEKRIEIWHNTDEGSDQTCDIMLGEICGKCFRELVQWYGKRPNYVNDDKDSKHIRKYTKAKRT